MSFSNYLEKAILDHVNGVGVFTPPTNQYLALYKSDPGEASSGTEVSPTVDDTAYARQLITFGAATLGTGIALSTNAQTFGAVVYGSGAAAYTVTHVAVFDALTGGNLIESTPMGASIQRLVGKTLAFDVASITVALD